ncbi:hypothetical protein CKAH01_13248 [Colletotrichum kahawae]|uniref:Uncharacterized protein n=1 Tax=Colletotrichum kahawae TaxID=34407 RepID=A0AAE0DBA5_COLKA|nr:hypothetical protein CKAH01_13248 [Colletotrichum kahawae]
MTTATPFKPARSLPSRVYRLLFPAPSAFLLIRKPALASMKSELYRPVGMPADNLLSLDIEPFTAPKGTLPEPNLTSHIVGPGADPIPKAVRAHRHTAPTTKTLARRNTGAKKRLSLLDTAAISVPPVGITGIFAPGTARPLNAAKTPLKQIHEQRFAKLHAAVNLTAHPFDVALELEPRPHIATASQPPAALSTLLPCLPCRTSLKCIASIYYEAQ